MKKCIRNLFKKLITRHACWHDKKDKNIKQNFCNLIIATIIPINTIKINTMPIMSYFI